MQNKKEFIKSLEKISIFYKFKVIKIIKQLSKNCFNNKWINTLKNGIANKIKIFTIVSLPFSK